MKTDFSITVQVNLGLTPGLSSLVSALLSQAPTTPAVEEQAPAPQQVESTPTAVEEQPKQTALTEEDIRTAMHRTRQRIEGEDYKDHTDSEAYQKYHKALTVQFKAIASILGADKPSALPAEQRAAFIKECDTLRVLSDGTVGNDAPF